MIATFAGLAIGLQAVAERVKELTDPLLPNRMPLLLECFGQLARTLARPTQRRFRDAAGRRLNLRF